MDVVRKKAIGRSMPKRGKSNRISRTNALLKRQSDIPSEHDESFLFNGFHNQGTKHGSKPTSGMRNA